MNGPRRSCWIVAIASECGLHGLTQKWIELFTGPFLRAAGLHELVEAATRIGRIAAGHVPGLPPSWTRRVPSILTYFPCTNWVDRLVILLRTQQSPFWIGGITGTIGCRWPL
ncbi:MAG: hypothetical protein U0905_14030 [Pirellulales bacterium]